MDLVRPYCHRLRGWFRPLLFATAILLPAAGSLAEDVPPPLIPPSPSLTDPDTLFDDQAPATTRPLPATQAPPAQPFSYGGTCATCGPQAIPPAPLSFADRLTGDWCDLRRGAAVHGITFDGDLTLFQMGVTQGGRNRTFNYAGHGDYRLNIDLERTSGWTGSSLMVRAEHRFGEPLSRDAGVLLPTNLYAATPTLKNEELIITNFIFTQALTENWTVFFGKLDTLDGDRNPFASGRGKTQFMNTSLLLPVHAIPTVPLATLGAGAVYSVDGMPLAQIMVLNASNTITTSGFDELFEDGAVIFGGINLPVPVMGRLGIHSFNVAWSSKTFTALGQDPRIITGTVPIAKQTGSWAVWYSGAQYLVQDRDDPTKGWGLFTRLGASDGHVNPVRYMMQFGIGGDSPLPGRDNDKFGIGWYYNRFSDDLAPILRSATGVGNSSSGLEAYYNYAVTPAFKVSPNYQLIEPGVQSAGTTQVMGVRAELDF